MIMVLDETGGVSSVMKMDPFCKAGGSNLLASSFGS